jgi:glutathione S-transferase
MSKLPILFYDIANKLGVSTSFNTLKTECVVSVRSTTLSDISWPRRFNLRYKRIPYETVWVEFGDIERVSKEIGAPPTGKKPDGTNLYTLPAIRDQDTGRAISDSFAIASYLDERYPERRLIPVGTEKKQAEFISSLMVVLGMVSFDYSEITMHSP